LVDVLAGEFVVPGRVNAEGLQVVGELSELDGALLSEQLCKRVDHVDVLVESCCL
jgi:hypothetical protein